MIHRKTLLASALLVGIGAASQAASAAPISPPFSQCPAVGASPTCAILFQFTDSGVNTFFDNSVGPYDGNEDTLVGVVNNSSSTVNSLALRGHGDGGGIFNFEGDGLQSYITIDTSKFPADYSPSGYEGPDTYFSNIGFKDVPSGMGIVNFIGGLTPGASTYFSLESSPSSIQSGGGIIAGPPGPSLPEPGSLALMGLGLPLAGLLGRRRSRAA